MASKMIDGMRSAARGLPRGWRPMLVATGVLTMALVPAGALGSANRDCYSPPGFTSCSKTTTTPSGNVNWSLSAKRDGPAQPTPGQPAGGARVNHYDYSDSLVKAKELSVHTPALNSRLRGVIHPTG